MVSPLQIVTIIIAVATLIVLAWHLVTEKEVSVTISPTTKPQPTEIPTKPVADPPKQATTLPSSRPSTVYKTWGMLSKPQIGVWQKAGYVYSERIDNSDVFGLERKLIFEGDNVGSDMNDSSEYTYRVNIKNQSIDTYLQIPQTVLRTGSKIGPISGFEDVGLFVVHITKPEMGWMDKPQLA